MMAWYMFVLVFFMLLGAVTLSYQIFRIVQLDAKCRGLKHPGFWGIFSLSGSNGGGGLILYLIGRRKYPIQINEDQKAEMNAKKKKALVSLCFLATGAVGLVITALFYMP